MDIYLWILIFFILLCVVLPLASMWAIWSGVRKGFKEWDKVFDGMRKVQEPLKRHAKTFKKINKISRNIHRR